MDLGARIERYKKIEAHRGRPLIVYATSTRPNVTGSLAGDSVRELIDQIDALPAQNAVDILMHSTGGDPLAAWKLMSVLRERFNDVAVLVPSMAFSAATLFALGANQIVMHPHASLGPIDPQIQIQDAAGTSRKFAYEDVSAFLRFLEEDCGLTERSHVSTIADRLFQTVDPLVIGAARRASDLSTSVGERLLRMHMKNPDDRDKPAQIARGLNKSFFAHGDAVSRKRARELGLNIAESNPELEKLLWSAFEGIEAAMELRKQWDPLAHFMSNPAAAAALEPPAQATIPADAPPQIAEQIWNMVAQQVLQRVGANSGIKVPFSHLNALVESPRRGSEFRTTGYISASRLPDGVIKCVSTGTAAGWSPVAIPASALFSEATKLTGDCRSIKLQTAS
jgi:hypothetical protein